MNRFQFASALMLLFGWGESLLEAPPAIPERAPDAANAISQRPHSRGARHDLRGGPNLPVSMDKVAVANTGKRVNASATVLSEKPGNPGTLISSSPSVRSGAEAASEPVVADLTGGVIPARAAAKAESAPHRERSTASPSENGISAGGGERAAVIASALPTVRIFDPPFARGERFRISAGSFGKSVHVAKYAADLAMPVGTPVCAAGDGTIIRFRSDWGASGNSSRSGAEGNFISIRHSDGTITTYKHLKAEGVLVRIGQAVRSGELIGYSGDTGHVTGPHLHFEATVEEGDGRMRSVPFAFRDGRGVVVKPERGVEITI